MTATACAILRSEEMVQQRIELGTATTFMLQRILTAANSISNKEQMHRDSSIDAKNEMKLTTWPIIMGNTEPAIVASTIGICQQEGKTKRGSPLAEDPKSEGIGVAEDLRAGGVGMREDQATGFNTMRPDQETGGIGTREGQR